MATSLSRRKIWGGQTPSREMPSLITQRRFFRYIVEIVGLNILFYWMKDRQWYTIETEKDPIEVRRIYPNPNWDGICEMTKSDLNGEPHTSSKGEIIATFESPIEVWGSLRINDVPIGEVLKDSVITDLD